METETLELMKYCGDYLGEGFRRIVYQHKNNPQFVLKFLKNPKDNHNRTEWENWQTWGNTERGLWLAPCIHLTRDGRLLMQIKIEVVEEAPSDIPDWIKIQRDYSFGGNKSRHWGRYQGRLVLLDYGDMPFI